MNPFMGREKFSRLVDAHSQDFTNIFLLVANHQSFRSKTGPAANLAGNRHIGQKTHLDLLYSLTLALLAPTFLGIEGEPAWPIAADSRLRRLGKQSPDSIPKTHIGRRARAGSFANGRLIHF
jgi:hypothetical protein